MILLYDINLISINKFIFIVSKLSLRKSLILLLWKTIVIIGSQGIIIIKEVSPGNL
jgi:hypothetical protein